MAVSEIRLQARYNGDHVRIARVQRSVSGISQNSVKSRVLKFSSPNYTRPKAYLTFEQNCESEKPDLRLDQV